MFVKKRNENRFVTLLYSVADLSVEFGVEYCREQKTWLTWYQMYDVRQDTCASTTPSRPMIVLFRIEVLNDGGESADCMIYG